MYNGTGELISQALDITRIAASRSWAFVDWYFNRTSRNIYMNVIGFLHRVKLHDTYCCAWNIKDKKINKHITKFQLESISYLTVRTIFICWLLWLLQFKFRIEFFYTPESILLRYFLWSKLISIQMIPKKM